MKIVRWLDRNIEIMLMVLTLLAIVFVMGAQVVARKFMGMSIGWSEELGRYLFVWMGFLSVSYTLRYNTIIRMDVLDAVLPPVVLKILGILVQVFMLILFGYLTYESFSIISTTNQRWSSVNLSMNLVYGAIPFCFGLTVIRLIQGIVLGLRSHPESRNAKEMAAEEEAQKSRMTEMGKEE